MTYTIEFSPGGARDLRKLSDEVRRRLTPHIDRLARDPRPRGALKMAGPEGFYRIRVGDYRVIYTVEDDRLIVLVVRIAHRREVYR